MMGMKDVQCVYCMFYHFWVYLVFSTVNNNIYHQHSRAVEHYYHAVSQSGAQSLLSAAVTAGVRRTAATGTSSLGHQPAAGGDFHACSHPRASVCSWQC